MESTGSLGTNNNDERAVIWQDIEPQHLHIKKSFDMVRSSKMFINTTCKKILPLRTAKPGCSLKAPPSASNQGIGILRGVQFGLALLLTGGTKLRSFTRLSCLGDGTFMGATFHISAALPLGHKDHPRLVKGIQVEEIFL